MLLGYSGQHSRASSIGHITCWEGSGLSGAFAAMDKDFAASPNKFLLELRIILTGLRIRMGQV